MTEDVLRRLKDANRWRVTGDHGLAPQQADRERRGRDEEQIRPAAHAGSEVDVAVPRVHRLRGRHVMSLPLGPTLLVRVKTRRFIGYTIQSRLGRWLGYQPRPPGHRSRETLRTDVAGAALFLHSYGVSDQPPACRFQRRAVARRARLPSCRQLQVLLQNG
jgi:hypothetical protein